MMRRKIMLLVALMISVGMILVACGGESTNNQEESASESSNEGTANNDGEEQEEFKFQIGHTTTTANQQHVAAEKLAELLEEKTNGSITMDVFELAQLGGEVEMIQALQEGTSAMTVTSHAAMTNFVPEWSVFDLPYLFDSTEQVIAVMDEIGDTFFDMLPEHGLKGLTWIAPVERNIYSTSPIESVDDLQGFTVRVIQAPGFVEAYSALGANPVDMSGDEVYTALQQGVVDGSVNAPDLFMNFGHYEVAKYYNLTRMHYLPTSIVMSLDIWEQLSPEQQNAVMEAADEAAEYAIEHNYKVYDEAFERMEAEGIEVVTPDISGFQEKTKELYDTMLSDTPDGEELLELIESTKEKVQ